jgi:hypothetical protein
VTYAQVARAPHQAGVDLYFLGREEGARYLHLELTFEADDAGAIILRDVNQHVA